MPKSKATDAPPASRTAKTVYLDTTTAQRFDDLLERSSKRLALKQTQLLEFCVKQVLEKYEKAPDQLILDIFGARDG